MKHGKPKQTNETNGCREDCISCSAVIDVGSRRATCAPDSIPRELGKMLSASCFIRSKTWPTSL